MLPLILILAVLVLTLGWSNSTYISIPLSIPYANVRSRTVTPASLQLQQTASILAAAPPSKYGFRSPLSSTSSAKSAVGQKDKGKPLSPGVALRRLQRLPLAVFKTTATSFISTAQVMVPIGCVLQIRTLFKEGFKKWVKKGSKMGIEWGLISGAFAGGETLFATLRGTDDRLNMYLGSGLASAIMGAKDGPSGVVQGFLAGFAFVYAIDVFLPSGEELPPTVGLPGGGIGTVSKLGNKLSPATTRTSAAAAVKRYKKSM